MRLKEKYNKQILPELKKQLSCQNNFQVPRLSKVVLNVGFGRMAKEKGYVDNVVDGLTRISGQKPVLNKAKKSISAFKIRQDMVIGASVTLRGQRMYDFVEKLINISFPRIRDFRGLNPKSIDKQGNLTVGFREYLSFPEIKLDEVDNVFGLEICLATTAKNYASGLALLTSLGFPFKKD